MHQGMPWKTWRTYDTTWKARLKTISPDSRHSSPRAVWRNPSRLLTILDKPFRSIYKGRSCYWTIHQLCWTNGTNGQNKSTILIRRLLYIIFVKFFLPIIPMFRFRSRRYFTSYWLFFHMLHFLHLYLFPVSSVFLMFPTFTCAPIHPSTCFHFSFHVLWLCSRPFPSYYDILYFYVLSLLGSRLIPTQYINQCIFLVVVQFVNWRWFSSSPIFSLSFLSPLKALSPLSKLSSSSGNYIFTKTNLQPSNLMSRLMSRPLTKF